MVGISEEPVAATRPKSEVELSRNFREVTNEDNDRRIRASLKVLQSTRNGQTAKTALTRIIRGTGATLTNSKIGFYTLLAGFLKEHGDSVSCADVFEVMDNELKITNKAKTRESADAYVGRMLTITAMIRQNMLKNFSAEQMRQCVQVIVEATVLKAYHSKLAYNALIALVQSEITENQMKSSVLPVLKKELKLTWTEHTMSSLHFMMELKWKFPKLVNDKFLRECFGVAEILGTVTFEHVYRIFWNEQNESSIMQLSYDALAKYAAASVNLGKFANFLAEKLESASSRNKEVITVKVVTEIVNNLSAPDKANNVLVTPFWAVVFRSVKKVKTTDEILRAVYLEFFEAIYNVIAKGKKELQITLIRTLLKSPGTINVDKFQVTNRIISRSINVVDEEVLCQLCVLLQDIITEQEPKGEANVQWLYTEKVTALGYLQKILNNKKVSIEQKTKSLHWLATHGLFEEPDTTVTPELAEQIKRLFYKTLESPHIKITDEKTLLLNLMAFVEKKKKKKTSLRQPLEKANTKMWGDVLKETQNTDANDNQVMFHVLLLHMALQLFNDPELASNAIKELHSCMQRATTSSLRRKTKRAEGDNGEPEWTEVMVDLILHLLSQNSVILRNVVKKVFPNICPQLNLSAVHQILSLLDMNESNPLLDQDNGDEEEEEEEEEHEAENEDGDDDEEEEEDEEEHEEEEEDGEDDEEMDHDASVSDQVRNAISMALMAGQKPEADDDEGSVDLDTMTEEEGQRLDEALANAFKLMGNRRGSGKTKTEKMETTALLHFRNRVIDLLIIYLKSSPDLVVVVEILSVLFRMLDQYSDDDAANLALFGKVQEAIDVAVATTIPQEVTTLSAADAVNYLRTFITKCANPKGIEERTAALQKIVRFFTQIDGHLPKAKKGESVADVLAEELKSFLTQRTPVMGLNIFQHVLQSNWNGIWRLLDVILEHGTTLENRVYKRAQSLDLLRTYQNNTRFLKGADAKQLEKHTEKFHGVLQRYKSLVKSPTTPKEFRAYAQLLLDVRLFHRKNANIACHLDWSSLEADVKELRNGVLLDVHSFSTYAQLCKIAGWEVVKNNKNGVTPNATNGHVGAGEGEEEEEGDQCNGEAQNGDTAKPTKKRKAGNDMKASLKEKKLKKEMRFKQSNGLDETIHFTEMS